MDFPKATQDNKQSDKKLRKNDHPRSGTGLSETKQRFFFLIVVVKDKFAEINNMFSNSHLALTLVYSVWIVRKKIESI